MEPKSIVAGTKISWSRPFSIGSDSGDYRYFLVSATHQITIGASFSAGEIVVEVPTDTSKSYQAGPYHWSLVEELGGEKFVVGTGRIQIEADPTTMVTAQVQTHSEKVLEAIRKRIEGRILSDHENYSIEGRSLSRIPIDTLHQLENKYAWRVYHEQVTRGERPKHRSIRFR